MRALASLAILVFLGACNAPAPAAKSEDQPAAAATTAPVANRAPVWLICDDLSGASVITLSTPDAANGITLTEYSKTGAAPVTQSLALGEGEGAAGSTYQALIRNGADAGHLRILNAGTGMDADIVTTPALTEILLGDKNHDCRWLARTRFVGFDARRSFWILEDAKGALTYQTFDFANAGKVKALGLEDGQRSTTPNVNVSGGKENADASGTLFTFDHEGWRYEVRMPRASVTVLHDGKTVQTENLLAYETAEDRD